MKVQYFFPPLYAPSKVRFAKGNPPVEVNISN